MATLRVVIVDDEEYARLNLKMLIESYCKDTEVVGMAGNVESAYEVISETSPDVVFLDIRMPSGEEGFELLDQLSDRSFHVIIVSAFKDYALKAFDEDAVHYLLKPVDIEQLQHAVSKIKSLESGSGQVSEILEKLKEDFASSGSGKIKIFHTKGFKIVDVDTIVRLEGNGNCTNLYFDDQSSYLDTRTLKVYEESLDNDTFIRIHKSHIINASYLVEYLNSEGHFAVLRNGDKVPVSRSKLQSFLDYLKEL